MACPCCRSEPPLDPGALTSFLTNGEVLEQVSAFRQKPGLKTKALKSILCGGSKLGGAGGTECREEGGCLQISSQCPMFAVTSPWYRANLPFLKCSMKIREQIENLLKRRENVKRDEKKTSADAIERKDDYRVFLGQTFKAYTDDIQDRVRTCPTR